MSSTNRGGKRNEADWYATPPWVCYRLLEELGPTTGLPGGRWLEPCAVDGAIIRAINSRRSDIIWSGAELRPETEPQLRGVCPGGLAMGDFLSLDSDRFGVEKFDVAFTNPPFSLALPFVQKCMTMAKTTVMLLRLNFWGSEERANFMRQFPPDTYVIPNRPVFSLNKDGKPGSDSVEYAWFVWNAQNELPIGERKGAIRPLRSTPKEERKAWNEHLLRLAKSHGLIEAAP